MSKVHFTVPDEPGFARLTLIEDDGSEHDIPYVKSVSMYVDVSGGAILTVELYQVKVDVLTDNKKVNRIRIFGDGSTIPEDKINNEEYRDGFDLVEEKLANG